MTAPMTFSLPDVPSFNATWTAGEERRTTETEVGSAVAVPCVQLR